MGRNGQVKTDTQINGLLLRAASKSSGGVSVTNTHTDRQTDTAFVLIYRIPDF